MPKSGTYLTFILLLSTILFNTSCRDKKTISVRQSPQNSDIQMAYSDFQNSLNENYKPEASQIHHHFIRLKSFLDEKEQLPIYSKMGEYFYKYELADSALKYFNAGLETAINTKNSYYLSYFHLKCGETLVYLTEYVQALNELKTAYTLSLSLDSVQLRIKAARNLGNVYWNKGEFDLALTYYFNSLDMSRKINDVEGIAAALNNIGIIYQEVHDYKKALDYYKQSETLAEKDHSSRLLASAYNNVGDVYSMQGKFDSALVYFEKAIDHVTVDDSKFSTGIYFGNIADVYLRSGSFEKAGQYFIESLKFANVTCDKIGIATCNLGLAEVYLRLKENEVAYAYLKTGTLVSEDIGSFKLLDYAYKLNSEYFYQKHDFPNAHFFLAKQLAIRDSFASREHGENIARLENRYTEVQNIREIEILKQKQNYFLSLLILGFIAFFTISLVIFIAYREKAKSNLLLKEKNLQIENSKKNLEEQHQQLLKSQEQLNRINISKDVFLTIISHDLKNPLSTIRGFTELLVQNYDSLSDEKRKLFINEVFDSIERITLLINNVLYWVKSQTDGIKFNPVNFNLSKRIDENISIYRLMMSKKEIQVKGNIREDYVVSTDINVFDMILRNLLSNALKFTEPKGKITIISQQMGNKIKLSITDTGIGIPEDNLKTILSRNQQYSTAGTSHEQGTGLGLQLVYRFIEQAGGNFEIVSSPGKGTSISFTLDLVV